MSCSFADEECPCGPDDRNPDDFKVIPLSSCNRDMSMYLQSLGLVAKQRTRKQNVLTEMDLILNRAGMFNVDDATSVTFTICPRHRSNLTLNWGKKSFKGTRCDYPTHSGKKLLTSSNRRRVNKEFSEEVYDIHKSIVPIGSFICVTCRLQHYTLRRTSKQQETEETTDSETQSEAPSPVTASEDSSSGEQASDASQTYQTSTSRSEPGNSDSAASAQSSSSYSQFEISIWEDEKTVQNENREALNIAIDKISDGKCSPVRSTLNTDWDDVGTRYQNSIIKKTKDIVSNVLKTIAPGQEDVLWNAVKRSSGSLDDTACTSEPGQKRKKWDNDTIKSLVAAYNNAQSSQTRTQILSIFVYDFTKAELQELIPALSKYKIDRARKHAMEEGAGQPVPELEIKRCRLDPIKIDHFLDFISTPTYTQDTAYGTKELKLDDGTTITIPNVIRTVIPSRIVTQYQSFCKSVNFEPTSASTLFRILRVCAASQQKSLQGLDYFLTEGGTAFDTLNDITSSLYNAGFDRTKCEEIKKDLKQGKFYLKTDYKTHIKDQDECPDHCAKHALTDPKNAAFADNCDHDHDLQCKRCYKLDKVLDIIKDAIRSTNLPEDELQRLIYEFEIARLDVEAWKAHILRTYNQESAKHDILNTLDENSIMLVMDWAMKYLPTRFREQMSDFFGKRGRSWHVACVISRSEVDATLEVECYVHLFNSCTQNWFAVASIIEDVLKNVKDKSSNITSAFLKSDNAGCYHSSQLLLTLSDIGKRAGIEIQRYDFSDPQSGKDICDRKIAPMKAHTRRFVNEKNDVVSAEDMKKALESNGGVKGCNFIVAEIDASKMLEAGAQTIEGVSLLNNFAYEKEGLRCWKAYNQGAGKVVTQISDKNPIMTGLKVVQAHNPEISSKGIVSQQVSDSKAPLFFCQEPGCVLSFHSYEDAELHMDTGEHSMEEETDTSFDRIRKKWAAKVSDLQLTREHQASHQQMPQASETTDESQYQRPKGWALKAIKRAPRIQEKVKQYLSEKFNKGVRTGNKADPAQVAYEMQHRKDTTGKLEFMPHEWRSQRQISSFFGRLSARQRHIQLGATPSGISELEEDMWDEEVKRRQVRNAVFGELDIGHPLMFQEHDLCTLAKRHKLNQFKLKDLEEICTEFEVEPVGIKSRKASFIKPLQVFIEQCLCFKQN